MHEYIFTFLIIIIKIATEHYGSNTKFLLKNNHYKSATSIYNRIIYKASQNYKQYNII